MLQGAVLVGLLAALAVPVGAAQKARNTPPGVAATFQSFLVVEAKLPTDPNLALVRLLGDLDLVHGPTSGPPTRSEFELARPSHLSPAVSLLPVARFAAGVVRNRHPREPEALAKRR